MSLYHVGIDRQHVIDQFRHSKQLATLKEEQDALEAKKRKKTEPGMLPYANFDSVKGRESEATQEELLKCAVISVKTLQDGTKAISEYKQPGWCTTFAQQKIDERKLIKDVSLVLGNLNLRDTSLTDTQGIKTVQGDLVIGGKHKLKDISSIKSVYGNIFVAAKTKEEAIAILKGLNFRPQELCGRVIPVRAIEIN